MNLNSFHIINSVSFQLLNEFIYQIKFYSEMRLCAHFCFDHFQTSQIYNMKKLCLCVLGMVGVDISLFLRKGGASQKRLGNTALNQ